MSDAVRDLADALGVAVEWKDFEGKPKTVADGALRRILGALGFSCETDQDIAQSRDAIRDLADRRALPSLITAQAGEDISLPLVHRATHARLRLEDGGAQDIAIRAGGEGRTIVPAIGEPGYHHVELDDAEINLAVAPRRCVTVDDIAPGEFMCGFAAQIYGLRRAGDGGAGDAGGVAALGIAAAQNGADALALSPSHALFTADPTRYSPYAPSSRLFLNPLYGDPRAIFGDERVGAAIRDAGLGEAWHARDDAPLIDWPDVGRVKLALLRRLFEDFAATDASAHSALAADLAAFRVDGGALLEEHARFEALHAARLAADANQWSWRAWPAEWQDAMGPQVERFAAEHAHDIAFQVFLQWIADRSFAAAQRAMRGAGARVGLISDLAVGTDPSGSHAWARQQDVLVGLKVGAPPDLFNQRGQDWGITTFSPQGLAANGFAPFLATLRAAMRHAGGVRIDHIMGLTRLWLVPDGAGADEGAYVRYPLDDFLRLIALESHRNRAIVIGEDLGTVPEGFRERLDAAGISGMRVMWFERDGHRFTPPHEWSRDAVAMTTTHDLPTVAGWWRGADIDVRRRHGVFRDDEAAEAEARARGGDRGALWRAFVEAGAAQGDPPPPENPEHAIAAAIGFVAKAQCRLAMLPLEDALGLQEQPNLPGTIDEHPNWRRRYPLPADEMLDAPEVQARLQPLKERSRS